MMGTFPFTRKTDRFRVALGLSYRGSVYHGWQIQTSDVPTIQLDLEKAISRVANETVATMVAGRTDAGVHASNQVVHFDTQANRSMYGWKMGINTHLPNDICVNWVKLVDVDFHARFSATERIYRFVIHNVPVRSAIMHDLVTWIPYKLDSKLMQYAADSLLGTHDFSSFRASECQAHSPVRTLRELNVRCFGDFLVIQVRADGFLHHMVRNLVGVLVPIGRQKKPVAWARQVLESRDRSSAGVTARGAGLYFVDAVYEVGELPQTKLGPDFIQLMS